MSTKFWLFVLAACTILLIAVNTIAVADTHDTTERWAPRFGYKACMSLEGFVPRMKEYGGELLSSGEAGGGIISVMVFPDSSFGIFIYDPVAGYVCNISTGWFVQPGMPV